MSSYITITSDPAIVHLPAVAWAIEKLREIDGLGLGAGSQGKHPTVEIVLLDLADSDALAVEGLADASSESESYSLTVTEPYVGGRRIVIVAGDERGYAYALSEVTERLRADGLGGLTSDWKESQRPAVPVRGIQRNFSSAHEDSPWFHDRSFWSEYLDHLAAQRFNRFHLALGMQYNYGTGWESRTATDNYLVFAYPFLLDVPGYQVRAEGISNTERDRNFEALAYIARETRRRGMSFQLGLWNHAYDFGYDSRHWYPILGIGPESHADYSAEALGLLLERIPEIDGVTFRVHHEGGIHEEGHEVFWEKIFDRMSRVGRPIEVDMHAKGVDQALIDAARKPNLRPVISAKYLAEHMGLPYHQASIRQHERQPLHFPGMEKAMTGVTDGDRRFTRYGYADYLNEDRPTDVMFRMWPGTQKLLLWGDPAIASGFGRYSTIGGSRGVEFCEPLTFKGRRGTGEPARRDPYVRDDLRLGVSDWRKYRYTYVLWGRLAYDPNTSPEIWQRTLRSEYGKAAGDFETALANLSRILPLVTVVHGVSGANNFYSPEMYVDLPISEWKLSMHYAWDTPDPKTWEGVSPFDPTLFYSIGEYADDAIAGQLQPKYTPLEVASWIETMVAEGERALSRATAAASSDDAQTLRTIIDLRVLIQLGRFFAGKFQSAVQYALFRRTGDTGHLAEAIRILEAAHAAYAGIARIVPGVYQDDLAFGVGASDRGTWSDRIMGMREDLHLLKRELERAPKKRPGEPGSKPVRRKDRWIADARFEHVPSFDRGESLEVRLLTADPVITRVVLHYRHLNQAEDYVTVEMTPVHDGFSSVLPSGYTSAAFPLVYFAEVHTDGDHPVFVPALNGTLSNQPYQLVHSSTWTTRTNAHAEVRYVAAH